MSERQAIVVVDLAFGDSGKGTVVDYLTRLRQAHTVVRYNGGPQAAHNVVTPDGRHHTFSQFGSGTFVSGTKTHLSRFTLIDPLAMMSEEKHLRRVGVHDAFERQTIDERAKVITPFQRAANRLRELARGEGRHGSCGMGVGETMLDNRDHADLVVQVRDLCEPETLKKKLIALQELKQEQLSDVIAWLSASDPSNHELRLLCGLDSVDDCLDWYEEFLERANVVTERFERKLTQLPGTLIFEGAQGVLIDEWHGFHPYTTWSTTTSQNAMTLLRENGYTGSTLSIGVLRAYCTRHGPGPFVTEDSQLTRLLPDPENVNNQWQGGFRCGWFDAVAARYALAVNGTVDYLAVTNVDRFEQLFNRRFCDNYLHTEAATHLLSSYFELDRERSTVIRDLRVGRTGDLEHQAQLTELLEQCRPEYQAVDENLPSYLKRVEDALNVRVGLVSRGPTASSKLLTYDWFLSQGVNNSPRYRGASSVPMGG